MSEEKEIFDKKFVYLEWDDVLKGKKVVIGDTLGELKKKLHNELFVSVMENKGDYPFTPSEDAMNFAMAYYDPLYDVKKAYAQGKTIQYKNKDSSDSWKDCSEEPYWTEVCEYRVKPEAEMWTVCISDEGEISMLPAKKWNKCKGRQLIEGTEEECRDYALENYCKKCVHEVSMCCCPKEGCQGFKEKPTVRFSKCSDCKFFNKPISDEPCRTCGVNSGHYTPKKKRRWTNRELAHWIAQGNGQVCKFDRQCAPDVYMAYVYTSDSDDYPVDCGVKIRGWDETEWHEPEVEVEVEE